MLHVIQEKIRQASWLLLLFLLPGAQALSAADYRFEGVDRVVVVGDVHGAYDELVTLLQGTGLVDAELRWSGGEAHLVSLGDLLDRGDYGKQVMDLLMRLDEEAAAAGGDVHVIHGNHEAMNLAGDLRYVSLGDYAQFGAEQAGEFPPGFFERRAALAPDGEYGAWLLDLPVAIVVNDTLFIHGGVSPLLDRLTLDTLNERARSDIRRFAQGWHTLLDAGIVSDDDGQRMIIARAAALGEDAAPEVRAAGDAITAATEGLPFIPDGPLWYRGNSLCHAYVETEPTKRVLEQFGAARVAVGHTPTRGRRITSRLDGHVLRVDTGMNVSAYQGRPSALVLEDGTVRAWYAGEGYAEVETAPPREWDRPYGMSDAEIEAFLLTADVTEVDAAGDAEVQRVVLEHDGRRLDAVFNTVDTAPGLESRRWRRGDEQAERFGYEIAAYRVDRLLELGMVPVTVEREIGDARGSLRLWIPGSFSERQRQAQQIPFTGACDLAGQYQLMSAFDVLILNAVHDLGTLRYDEDWRLWLTDQSEAFGVASDVRAMLRNSELTLTPQMGAALETITAQNVAPLSAYLHPRQLEALVTRATQLQRLR
ncbi:metallophosphoesterase [Wenzhouxiangella sp. XN24]|uniref:metallophosphoesterase n=1 Tax=Wenzhouxiangella sp. XN24 TaxID=2713569 RepID=UPI0013EBF3C5|nr:metallophosphoesterase [Wenzhouxiangella sp. XN24]NGX15810.1 hypothetical protein [Wenzhouxiangella sp. XN24]